MRMFGRVAAFAGLMLAGLATAPAAAQASGTPMLTGVVAYVRDGNIYISSGVIETQITDGGGYSRPRWSPDGKSLAYLRRGQLWTMRADGTGARRLTTRPAAGPSWSPDGKWLAFSSLSCTGGPGVYRISATTASTPTVLFPAECRDQDLPDVVPPVSKPAGTLTERLATDDAVAWSPDGTKIAFRGGECDAVYDSCLTIGTVATGEEKIVAAYGGGSLETSGFAVVPDWRPDGAKLAFTAYQKGETTAQNQPVHVIEYDVATGVRRTVGTALDREMSYLGRNQGVVTGQYAGRSWIVLVSLTDGTRQPFHAGSQPSVWQPPASQTRV